MFKRLLFAVLAPAIACASSSSTSNTPKKGGEYEVEVEKPVQAPPSGAPPPLTEAGVMLLLEKQKTQLEDCYSKEMLSAGAKNTSDYVYELRIPNDGHGHHVETLKATNPAAFGLEPCVTGALRAVKFPAHSGAFIVMRVLVHAPTPDGKIIEAVKPSPGTGR